MAIKSKIKTVTSEIFSLEHFYYGQLVHRGQPTGDLRLLAKSSEVSEAQIAEAVRYGLVPPMEGVPDGSWALLRGKNVPFVMVQSGQGGANQSMLHFIIIPPAVLRVLAGNLKTLRTLVKDSLPTYDRLGDTLLPLTLSNAGSPSADHQVDSILDLMTYTGNQMPIIAALLTALIEGVSIVVRGAPTDIAQRTTFMEGLLALLPPSARSAVTFATNTALATNIEAQIRFSEDSVNDRVLLYDWANQSIDGGVEANAYASFIISQLRLDAELVIRQTRALTSAAAWRLKEGDTLADALGYASHRVNLDDALSHNQPVQTQEISRILGADPTLSDEQRAMYARHVMTFSLAMDDMQYADPVGIMLRSHPALSDAMRQQLDDAISDGKVEMIYEALLRWMANPLGPQGDDWVALAHRAMLTYLQMLIEDNDIDYVHEFLDDMREAAPGLAVGKVAPRIMEQLLPLIAQDGSLAGRLFLIAIKHLPIAALRRLLSAGPFLEQLPRAVSLAMAAMSGEPGYVPEGLLLSVARSFDDEWYTPVMTRFVELAGVTKHFELIDAATVNGLVVVALSPDRDEYAGLLLGVVQHIDPKTLEHPGPLALLQILLALGHFEQLVEQMIRHSRVLYPGDLQPEYVKTVQRLFAQTPGSAFDVRRRIEGVKRGGIKGVPFMMATIGALEAAEWDPTLEDIANFATRTLRDHPEYLPVTPPDAILALLKFYVINQNDEGAIRAANLVAGVIAHQDQSGLNLIREVYSELDWDKRVKNAALGMLRRYVREARDGNARKAVAYFGREYGKGVRAVLETTYTLRRLMDGRNIHDYAWHVHVAAEWLHDAALTYANRKQIPTVPALAGYLEEMPGALNRDQRHELAANLMTLGKNVVALGRQQASNSPRNVKKYTEHLLAAKTDPLSTLDVLLIMSGAFARGKRFPTRLESSGFPNPMRGRTMPELGDDVQVASNLFATISATLPLTDETNLSAKMIRSEMESIREMLSAEEQQQLAPRLARDLQRLVDLAAHISGRGDAKVLQLNDNLGRNLDKGRQQPRNTLEMFRFLNGFFLERI